MPIARLYRHTELCVLCLKKKAKVWCGHVRDGKKCIMAGWCNQCDQSKEARGFVGHYKKKMKTFKG